MCAGCAACGLRGHRCGAGAAVGVGLLLAGGAVGRGDLLRWRGAGGVIGHAAPSLIRADPAGDPVQRAGRRADGGKMGKRKRPGQAARCALLLWPLVCTGGNGSGGVRPGAGGGVDLLAVPVGMVSAGTVPGATVPAWHGLRWRCSIRAGFGCLPEGSDSPPNGSEKQV